MREGGSKGARFETRKRGEGGETHFCKLLERKIKLWVLFKEVEVLVCVVNETGVDCGWHDGGRGEGRAVLRDFRLGNHV
jgi:hypothetical protein